jgi:predicted dehydrogenase
MTNTADKDKMAGLEEVMTGRRTFLFTAAASLAQAQTAKSSGDPVRIGVIGVGGRGTALMTDVSRTTGARVTHLCDVDQSRLERAQAGAAKLNFGTVKGSTDMRRVLEDKNVDAVVIATPDHWHAPAAILACDAGKDVYVEKPISHNFREGRLLVDAARRNKRIVQAGMQSRSRPNTMKAIEIARSGRVGRILVAKGWNTQLRKNIGRASASAVPAGVDYDLWVGPAEMAPYKENRFHYNWHWDWNFGTGDMGNDGAHQLDQARWVLGETLPKRVSGMAAKYFFDDDQQTPDTMNMTFDYGSKAIVWEMRIWTPYTLNGIDNGIAVYGTDGQMHIGDWNGKWGYRIFEKDKLVEESQEGGPEFHMQNFVDCVRSRQKPNCEIEEGHLSTALCHLGNICARTRRNFDFNAVNESIPGDAEANGLLKRKYRNHWATPKGV